MTRVQHLLVESVSYIRSYGVSAIQYLYDASNEEEWYDGKSEFYSRFGDANIIYRNEIEEILKDIEKSYNIQR